MNILAHVNKTHPVAEWAAAQNFDAMGIDCTTTVVLKILDGKCKMLPGEKAAIMAIYDVVRAAPGILFDATVHQTIDNARQQSNTSVLARIHELRVYAETNIPKSLMKEYKAMLKAQLLSRDTACSASRF